MNDEGGHPDGRDDIADIDLAVHAHERDSSGRAGAKSLKARSGGLCGASAAALNDPLDHSACSLATAFCETFVAACGGNTALLLSRACSMPGG
jgi:hypothetical protein